MSRLPQRRPIAYPQIPPISLARTDTTTTAVRSSLFWLAATVAAPMAAGPTAGRPAHERVTVMNSTTYGHHVPPIGLCLTRRTGTVNFARTSGKTSIRALRDSGQHPPEGDCRPLKARIGLG